MPVSIGLIVTECVINAYKHAFRSGKMDGQIVVAYESTGAAWKLSIADNGMGIAIPVFLGTKAGLGTSIVNALAQQLDAQVDVVSSERGTKVSITHTHPKVTETSQGVNMAAALDMAEDLTAPDRDKHFPNLGATLKLMPS